MVFKNVFKNHVLWMIKNVHHPGFLFWFYLLLPYRLLINFFKNKNTCIGLMQAMKKLPEALTKRTRSGIIVKDVSWLQQLLTSCCGERVRREIFARHP